MSQADQLAYAEHAERPARRAGLSASIYIKRDWAERLFAKSSREQRGNDTKLSQITDATPGLNLRRATCAKRHLPRSARRKTSKRPLAILDLRRKYTVFRARSYAANTKEEPQPLFANSSRERRRNVPKRSQLSHAVPHINIRW